MSQHEYHNTSILCFILLIFFYSWRMNKLEERFGIKED
ncbi:sodium/substrate symporter small subunit [Moraxella catarrhalis]|nr:sodium/substrate symporter small subunit [Moraxella catarrhalis]